MIMAQNTIRRLAADILKCGESRVWFDPATDASKRIFDALTRDDVRALVKEGLIKAHPVHGVSHYIARQRAIGRRAGRRRGHGSRKGSAKARRPPKAMWMAKVRSQRLILSGLMASQGIRPEAVRKVYSMIKGNAFRSKAALHIYLKENNLLSGPAGGKS